MSHSGTSLAALIGLLALQSHVLAASYSLAENGVEVGGSHSSSAHYSSEGSFGAAFSEAVITSGSGGFLGLGYIGALNDPPLPRLSQTQVQTGTQSEILISYLLGNAYDPEGHSYTLLSVSPFSLLGVPIERTATSIIYRPSTDNSLDSYTYVLGDRFGAASQGTVIITTGNPTAPILNISILNEAALLTFQGLPGRTYQILATDTLTSPTWRAIATPISDFTGKYDFLDPDVSVRTRFYRLMQF